MKNNSILLILIIAALFSCNDKKKQLSFYDNSEILEDSVEAYDNQYRTTIAYDSSKEVSVPFTEQAGLKLIDVTVNRKFTVKMILDSGCSGTLISIAEAKYLFDKGCFTEEDILGTTKSMIADGSIVENMVINLRELVIGGQIVCTDVTATVSENTQAPLLLGNEVLNRAPSYSVDNKNKVIKFQLQ